MDDEGSRTLWCGNLNEKVTEDILYELFLQGGPVEKVNIPKDRNGKQRTYGFVTYKHKSSVGYALELYQGTKLFNRPVCLQARSAEPIPPEPQEQVVDLNQMIQMGNQMLLGSFMPNFNTNMYSIYPPTFMMPNQVAFYPHGEDRRQSRSHPYTREHDRNNRGNGERDDRHSREHWSHRNKHSSHPSNWNNNNRRNYR